MVGDELGPDDERERARGFRQPTGQRGPGHELRGVVPLARAGHGRFLGEMRGRTGVRRIEVHQHGAQHATDAGHGDGRGVRKLADREEQRAERATGWSAAFPDARRTWSGTRSRRRSAAHDRRALAAGATCGPAASGRSRQAAPPMPPRRLPELPGGCRRDSRGSQHGSGLVRRSGGLGGTWMRVPISGLVSIPDSWHGRPR